MTDNRPRRAIIAPSRRLALAFAVLVGASCSSSNDTRAPSPPATATTTSAAPATSPAPTNTTAPSPAPPPGIDATWTFASPGWMAADEHHLFVRVDSGQIERIDPATNTVDGELELHSGCQGIGAAAGSVWACDDDGIVRIDPIALQVVARVPVTKGFEQGHIVYAAERVWLLTGDGSRLVGIDPSSNTPGEPISLPIRGTDLAPAGDRLWIVSKADGVVVLFDPDGTAVVQRIDGLDRPGTIAADDDGAWISGSDWTAHVDAATGTIDRRNTSIGDGTRSSIAVGGGGVWVPSTNRSLDRLDNSTAASTRQWLEGIAITTGAEAIYAFGSAWIAAYDDGTLWRITA